jgi:hypothetical protein
MALKSKLLIYLSMFWKIVLKALKKLEMIFDVVSTLAKY